MIEGFELDPDWPRLSLAEVERACSPRRAPGSRWTKRRSAADPTRVWKNAPPSLAFLVRHSRSHGERLFTIFEDERVSFEAPFRAAAALAAELARLGVGKGDRVAIAMANLPEWPVAFFAIDALGAIAVPLNAWWTGPELEYGLADSGGEAADRRCAALAADRAASRRPARARACASSAAARAAAEGAGRLEGTDRRAAAAGQTCPTPTCRTSRSSPTTRRPSSTPAAPPASPRARSAPTATCSPTSSRSAIPTPGRRCAAARRRPSPCRRPP